MFPELLKALIFLLCPFLNVPVHVRIVDRSVPSHNVSWETIIILFGVPVKVLFNGVAGLSMDPTADP